MDEIMTDKNESYVSYICTHLGEKEGNFSYSIVPPIYETVNFCFENVEEAQEYFARGKKTERYYYTRESNPTTEILEQKIAALEKAPACKVFASGMGAIGASILGLARKGDHIVAVKEIYKNSYRILSEIASRYGIEVTFVNGQKIKDFEEALRPNTRLFYLESPSSYHYTLQDLKGVSELAKSYGIITLIDNTIATPFNQNPRDFGIDIVIHSGSKYLNGHGDVIYGAVCSEENIIEEISKREYYLRGNILGPFESWLALRGLRTFAIRMAYLNKVGIEIARFLEAHPGVCRVYYPMLKSHPQYELAKRQMRGAGSLLAIELKGGIDKVKSFINNLKLFKIAASWGSFESLVWYPMIGRKDNNMELSPSLVRLSIGLENPELIKEDLEQALGK